MSILNYNKTDICACYIHDKMKLNQYTNYIYIYQCRTSVEWMSTMLKARRLGRPREGVFLPMLGGPR